MSKQMPLDYCSAECQNAMKKILQAKHHIHDISNDLHFHLEHLVKNCTGWSVKCENNVKYYTTESKSKKICYYFPNQIIAFLAK